MIDMEPGEIALVPSAISYRTAGTNDCLRVRVANQEAVAEGVDPEKPTTQNTFTVKPSEPIGAPNGHVDSTKDGSVLEHISFWDPQSDLWVERDVAALIGCKRGRPSGAQA